MAAAFDDLLGATQTLSGIAGFTGTLTIKMVRPTPLNRRIDYEGGVASVEGRKILTWGRSTYAGEEVARAEGLFISPRAGIDDERMVRARARAAPRPSRRGGDRPVTRPEPGSPDRPGVPPMAHLRHASRPRRPGGSGARSRSRCWQGRTHGHQAEQRRPRRAFRHHRGGVPGGAGTRRHRSEHDRRSDRRHRVHGRVCRRMGAAVEGPAAPPVAAGHRSTIIVKTDQPNPDHPLVIDRSSGDELYFTWGGNRRYRFPILVSGQPASSSRSPTTARSRYRPRASPTAGASWPKSRSSSGSDGSGSSGAS